MKSLRRGYSTGTCAAGAVKAALQVLLGRPAGSKIRVSLPDGQRVTLPLVFARGNRISAQAAIRKDAGDDPDATHGVLVMSEVGWVDGDQIEFAAGKGVGTVTKPGLAVSPGEPAINPVPRSMITQAVRELTDRGVRVILSIPGGEEIAKKTFNPRLGIRGGLSILGTSGRVVPYSSPALRESLRCSLQVAAACGVTAPVLVPGEIGRRTAHRHFRLDPDQVVQAVNQWGFVLDLVAKTPFSAVLVLGHPGKLAKLTAGHWNTHSRKSPSALPLVVRLARQLLDVPVPDSPTVEGVFMGLETKLRRALADRLAALVRQAVCERLTNRLDTAVVLANLQGDLLGSHGRLTPWR